MRDCSVYILASKNPLPRAGRRGLLRGRTPRREPDSPDRLGRGPDCSPCSQVVCSYEEVAHFGGDDGVFERPLPLAGCASLRAAYGRAYIGSLSPEIADFRDDERRLREPSFEPRSRVVAPHVAPPARFVTRPLSLCSLGLAARAVGPVRVPARRRLTGRLSGIETRRSRGVRRRFIDRCRVTVASGSQRLRPWEEVKRSVATAPAPRASCRGGVRECPNNRPGGALRVVSRPTGPPDDTIIFLWSVVRRSVSRVVNSG